MATKYFPRGQRPAVKVITPNYSKHADGWSLVKLNSKTATLRHPGIIGELPFALDEVQILEELGG
ncbi:hypothetical protein ACFVAJ_17380 [Agromyces sp. NPDC057679]|uniref:hypothetical protein n=1 Tax=Agromyces sp. NPDC057679 TaxID=3346207 RepID=UPI00366D885F